MYWTYLLAAFLVFRGSDKANASQNADGDDEEDMPPVPEEVLSLPA